MKVRHLESRCWQVKTYPLTEDPVSWLQHQAKDKEDPFETLLAYADDGVIWGRVKNHSLLTAHTAFPAISPELQTATLQQARLFGPTCEWFLWRTAAGWQVRSFTDGTGKKGKTYDEVVLLWGTEYEDTQKKFTLVAESIQGLRHAPPVKIGKQNFKDGVHPLSLHVRHYLEQDKATGLYTLVGSRLVKLHPSISHNQGKEEIQ
ncbi:MAG: TIGR03984 family CRISPR-associated protein [Anaerolineae bacterium]|nr:TIGR03984 family CRISPR-associated protein [Anaerolineae bacterium]